MTRDEMATEFSRMSGQIKSLKHTALQISWNMRGGVSYDDAMMMSSDERDIVFRIIKENIEPTKKTGLPYF